MWVRARLPGAGARAGAGRAAHSPPAPPRRARASLGGWSPPPTDSPHNPPPAAARASTASMPSPRTRTASATALRSSTMRRTARAHRARRAPPRTGTLRRKGGTPGREGGGAGRGWARRHRPADVLVRVQPSANRAHARHPTTHQQGRCPGPAPPSSPSLLPPTAIGPTRPETRTARRSAAGQTGLPGHQGPRTRPPSPSAAW